VSSINITHPIEIQARQLTELFKVGPVDETLDAFDRDLMPIRNPNLTVPKLLTIFISLAYKAQKSEISAKKTAQR